MKLLKNYIKSPICYNKHQWGPANVISSIDEYNRVAKFAFSLGTMKLTRYGHLHKDSIPSQGAV